MVKQTGETKIRDSGTGKEFTHMVVQVLLLWTLLYFTGSFVISFMGCGLPYIYIELLMK